MMSSENPLTPTGKTVLGRIDAIVAEGAPTLDAIAEAVRSADYDRAALLALARALAGEELPIAAVLDILPGVHTVGTCIALVNASTGPKSWMLVGLVRSGRMPLTPPGLETAALLLYLAWRRRDTDELRGAMVWPIRRILRLRLSVEAMLILAKLVEELADENLTSAAKDLLPAEFVTPEEVQVFSLETDALIAESPRELAKRIRFLEDQPRVPARLTVRAAPKPGRNEPCPCGSGAKYKRCCQDKDAASSSPSPIAGLSWTEYLARAADTMTVDTVRSLRPRDLARVNLAGLATPTLVVAYRRFMAWRRWDLAERALAVVVERHANDLTEADEYRAELVAQLVLCEEWGLARRQADLVADPSVVRGELISIAVAEGGSEAVARMVDAAARSVGEGDADDEDCDLRLALGLLESAPALGILVARGCLTAERVDDSELLLEHVEIARDRLNLPPGDRAWEQWSVLSKDKDNDQQEGVAAPSARRLGNSRRRRRPVPIAGSDAMPHAGSAPRSSSTVEPEGPAAEVDVSVLEAHAVEINALRAALRESSARVGDLEHQLRLQQANAVAAGTALPSPRESNAASEELRRLHAKVDELKALIGSGNEERRDLRRKLAAASRGRPSGAEKERAEAVSPEDEESHQAKPVDMGARGVLIPKVSRRAEDSLRRLQTHVAAEAMRTIGSLAGGDRGAWHRVKQAKDMGFALLMARVGIHHRLLFRADEGVLEVLDVVTRESLDTTLKRLRAA